MKRLLKRIYCRLFVCPTLLNVHWKSEKYDKIINQILDEIDASEKISMKIDSYHLRIKYNDNEIIFWIANKFYGYGDLALYDFKRSIHSDTKARIYNYEKLSKKTYHNNILNNIKKDFNLDKESN